MYLLLVISVVAFASVCACLLCCLCRSRREIAGYDRLAALLLPNLDAYVVLADADFNVVRTNYYSLTGTARAVTPPKVGNLLRCRNGEDAGVCGTHDLCADCPLRAAIGHALQTGENFRGLEAPMVLYTSAEHTQTIECEVSVSGSYLIIDNRPHMLLTVHDITSIKQTQRELTEARTRAEASDRMKSQFLANTSHELRTPLNAIIGFSELLAADSPTPEKREYMRIIRSNNELLLSLINDILDLSKIEAGTFQYEYADVELNAVMEEQEGIFRMRQRDAGVCGPSITFRRRYDSCYIRTDRMRLTQVLSNFLSNAVKYTDSGSIDFGFELRDKEVYVSVTDTGMGIEEANWPNVFKRFVKIGPRQGVGIGLAISKSIVEALGGHIGFESRFGEGSTFWFTLPREPKN